MASSKLKSKPKKRTVARAKTVAPPRRAAAAQSKRKAATRKPKALAAGERTGASRIADIPADILRQLNRGLIEAKTLAENLAIDSAALFAAAFPQAPSAMLRTVKAGRELGVVQRTRLAGEQIAALGDAAVSAAATHTSDMVRGWAAFATAKRAKDLPNALNALRRFADDPNAGVREWAWMTVRDRIASDAASAIKLLVPWTRDRSPNIRRFASEATRPRGVWAAHIGELRKFPALGLPILENLKNDESRYVQNSVGNWLNDAAKDNAAWVQQLTRQWLADSSSAATAYIVKRALRTVVKAAR
jgi:3-methyladenine DNA glycosylase AlkC